MLRYTSSLAADYQEALEQLMFFNPGQQAALAAIVDSVEEFGAPGVYVEADRLRVKVEKLPEVQSLFALDDDALVGALVYARIDHERLAVIHIAVAPAYSLRGGQAGAMLVMRMLGRLRDSARRIKGVASVRILYGGNRWRDLAV